MLYVYCIRPDAYDADLRYFSTYTNSPSNYLTMVQAPELRGFWKVFFLCLTEWIRCEDPFLHSLSSLYVSLFYLLMTRERAVIQLSWEQSSSFFMEGISNKN